jgi:two-component system heavy metal sensor histidine kinase CusS
MHARPTASLAWRVTAFVALATTLMFITFGMVVVRSLDQHFADQDAGELAVVAESVQRVLHARAPVNSDTELLAYDLSGAVAGHHGVFFYVADVNGKQIYSNQGPDLSSVVNKLAPVSQINTQALRIMKIGDTSYRVVSKQLKGDSAGRKSTYTVVVASNMDAHLRYIKSFEKTLWLTTVVVCAIALLAAWLAVKKGHAPIRRISAQIRSITSSQLHVRLRPEDVPIELADLVGSFNDMLEKLEAGFRQLSNFSADIAHELRTPVTNLSTETQVALSKVRSIDEYREILYSNLEEFEHMSKMIGDMLFLAQTENDPSNIEMHDVDLAQEVRGLFDYFEAWAEERGVLLQLEGAATLVQGDPLMIRRALSNLLSNAIRYTPAGSAVTVRLSFDSHMILVEVCNPGDDIPPEHLPHLFDRFYRVDPSRQRKGEGAGLGLSIVKSIIEAHHGNVNVTSENSLTCFQISLPAAKTVWPRIAELAAQI